MVCPKFNSPGYNLQRWNPGVHICFHFANRGSKEVLLLGACPMFPKSLGGFFFHFPPFLMCSHQVLNEKKYFQQMNFKAFCLPFLPTSRILSSSLSKLVLN
jgi:hypothetical protein